MQNRNRSNARQPQNVLRPSKLNSQQSMEGQQHNYRQPQRQLQDEPEQSCYQQHFDDRPFVYKKTRRGRRAMHSGEAETLFC